MEMIKQAILNVFLDRGYGYKKLRSKSRIAERCHYKQCFAYCLFFYAGMSVKEISFELLVSRQSITYYYHNIAYILDCPQRSEAQFLFEGIIAEVEAEIERISNT